MNKKDRELSKLYDDFYEYAHMVAVSYSNIKEDQQINEYVHESLMTLINKVNEGKYDDRNGEGNFGGWCRTVIKNKMNDSVRKKIVRSNRNPLHYMLDELADDEPLENDTIEDSVMDKFLKVNYDRVKRELNKLSYRYRMCMEYYYIEGYSVKDISEMLNISKNTVKTNLMKGRNNIKEKLGGPVLVEE